MCPTSLHLNQFKLTTIGSAVLASPFIDEYWTGKEQRKIKQFVQVSVFWS